MIALIKAATIRLLDASHWRTEPFNAGKWPELLGVISSYVVVLSSQRLYYYR
jgi:hypothetical protein